MWAPINTTYYVKLQDAFIAENGNVAGQFGKIGYEMSETAPFNYNDKVQGGATYGTAALTNGGFAAWEGKAKVALNDCPTNATWTLTIKAASNGNGAAWEATISDNKCDVLTPRFKDLQRGTSAAASGNNG